MTLMKLRLEFLFTDLSQHFRIYLVVIALRFFFINGGRVYLFILGHTKMYTPGTIANSQTDDRTSTKINKNGAVAKVIILVELGIL